MQIVQARFSRGCVLGMRVVGIVWGIFVCFKIGSNLRDKEPSGKGSVMD